MAAPEYVPSPATDHPRVYQSPPRRPDPWINNRPGDFNGRQPLGPGLGAPGPDQGYALHLARAFEGRLVLSLGEHEEDAIMGCVAVAMKRASLFGRAPVVHDLTVAFTLWGYLGDAPGDLLALRRPLFEEVKHPHHYLERRAICDAVPEATLRLTPQQVAEQLAADWRSLIDVERLGGAAAGAPPSRPVEYAGVSVADADFADAAEVVDDQSASAVTVEATSPPEQPPVIDEAPAVETPAAIEAEPVDGVELSANGEAPVEDVVEAPAPEPPPPPPPAPEPAVAHPHTHEETDEIVALTQQAKLAFRRRPKPPTG